MVPTASPMIEPASRAPAPAPRPPRHPAVGLLAAAGATALLWQIPYGELIGLPFTLLATWFHEMGHGLAALLLGGDFERLEIFASGSGVAHWRGAGFGRFAAASVAAAGPLGPAIAGAVLILTGRSPRLARAGLVALAAVLALSLVLWVRTLVGLVAVAGWTAVTLGASRLRAAWARQLALQLMGAQACVSTYRQVDYLFTRAVVIDGEAMLSDSGQIASALFLPHWVWGTLLTVACAGLLLASVAFAYRSGGVARS